MIGFIAGLPPVILKTLEGLAGTRPVLVDVGRSLKLGRGRFLQDPVARGAADDVRRRAPRPDLRLINIVGVEFLINYGGLGQLINELAERYDLAGTYAAICFVILTSVVLHRHRTDRAMAATTNLARQARRRRARPARWLRSLIAAARRDHCRRLVVVVGSWHRASGLFYRDVVPSLLAIGRSGILAAGSILIRNSTGISASPRGGRRRSSSAGLAGLVVGFALGGNRFLAGAFEHYLYYLGPTPKIMFFPIMIMWFGVARNRRWRWERCRASSPSCSASQPECARSNAC